MRKLTVTILIIALLTGYIPYTAAASAELTNGGFDNGTAGWTTVNASLTAESDETGRLCGKVEMKEAYGRAANKYKFTKDIPYIVSVYVRIPKGKNTASLIVDHRSFGDKSLILAVVKNVRVSNEWTKLTGIYTFTGAGTGEANLYVRIGDSLKPVTYYIDDLSVRAYGDAPKNYSDTVVDENEVAVNTGFENGIDGYILNGTSAYIVEGGAKNTASSAKVLVNSSPGRIGQKVNLESYTNYDFSAYIKSETAAMEFDIIVTLERKREEEQEQASYIRDYSKTSDKAEVTIKVGSFRIDKTDWTKINAQYLHRDEAGTATVSIQCNAKNDAVFYLDNFSVVKQDKTQINSNSEKTGIYINGIYAADTSRVLFENGTVVCPVSQAGELFDANVLKESEDVYSISIALKKLLLNAKSNTACINGKLVPINKIYMSNGEMYADLNSVCKAFDAELTQKDKNVYITMPERNSALGNFSYRLANEKKANIAFVGGSAAYGMGAGVRDKTSYRALVMTWLKDRFPDCSFNEINAAKAQADSKMAAYTIDSVLSQNPDIIFWDFCPEDRMLNLEDVVKYEKSAIYKIRKERPQTDIVSVIGYCPDFAKEYSEQRTPETIKAFDDVAKKYKVPVIDLSKKLYDEIKKIKIKRAVICCIGGIRMIRDINFTPIISAVL